MTIWEIAAIVGVCLGIAGAVILFLRDPTYWVRAVLVVLTHFAPTIIAWLTKLVERMPPEEEAEWHAAIRRGEGDEWLKARQRRKMLEKKNGTPPA